MADPNEPQPVAQAATAPVAAAPPPAADPVPAAPRAAKKVPLFVLLCAAAALAAGGAGYGVAVLVGPSQAGAAPTTEEPAPAAAPQHGGGHGEAAAGAPGTPAGDEFVYYEFEPIVVNLDEPRLARYVRVSITLAIKPENALAAKAILERRKPELKNWLTVFFASCTLEEARGSANLNRLRREILDNFSQQLWPDQPSMINHVLFKEFAVQ
jgi:flagellar basal body-associated protein FliL